VADQIAVLDHGRLQQVGTPRELYDEPATEFVMRFVGDASALDGELVRPHDIDLGHEPAEGAVEAIVERVTLLGFAAKIELVDGDGRPLVALMTRGRADELELERGQIVWARAAATVAVA
jgi:sulfate/thiosulfate transport system ATP-binding protein